MIIKDEVTRELCELIKYTYCYDEIYDEVFFTIDILLNNGLVTYRYESDITYSI